MAEGRTNEEWLEALSQDGSVQEAAIDDLRDLLLRASVLFFSRNLSDFGGLSRNEILQRAEDSTQDALIAVMKRLSDFRGDSKFTTWAYKFAINHALMAARRERLKAVSLDALISSSETTFLEWMIEDKSNDGSPEHTTMRGEVREIIRDVIVHDLTEKQRLAVKLMIFNEVPLDELVRIMGSNRNAGYKLLHDARRKLKAGLQARGFEVGETLELFAPQR
jgi:RNA polymerase sigma-70 factor (ECF subfamily)